MPQLWEKILAEKSVPHPSAEHRPTIMVNRECLQHFVDTCVSNRMTSIPINCPIVPLLNVEKFKEKLESKDVILSVINNSGHYLPLGKEFEKLFDSLICSVQQIMR
ncbi:Lanosterol synthase [Dirofilaria immitis]